MRIEVEGLVRLRKQIKKLDVEADRTLRTELKSIAETVATSARSNASWSSTIPGAIKSSVTQRGASLRVSQKRARHARVYEYGSKGNKGQVRHMLFGNRGRWFSNATRPYIVPALRMHVGEGIRKVELALQRAINGLGLGG